MRWVASLNDTVSRVIHSESKRFNARMRADKGVYQEVHAGLEAEEACYRRARLDFQEHMERKREKARVEDEIKDAVAKMKRARKEQRSAEAVVTAMAEVKAYSLELLGKGKKNRRQSAASKGTPGSARTFVQGRGTVGRTNERMGFFQANLGSRDG